MEYVSLIFFLIPLWSLKLFSTCRRRAVETFVVFVAKQQIWTLFHCIRQIHCTIHNERRQSYGLEKDCGSNHGSEEEAANAQGSIGLRPIRSSVCRT
jgi:hypothetical protein